MISLLAAFGAWLCAVLSSITTMVCGAIIVAKIVGVPALAHVSLWTLILLPAGCWAGFVVLGVIAVIGGAHTGRWGF